MGAPPAPWKDPVPTPTPADLHARADAIWRLAYPNDVGADIYSAAAAALLEGLSARSQRAAKWVQTLHRYEDHWRERGHAPRENTRARHTLSPEERRLGEWGRYQRRFEDQLNAYQRARLDVSPAFEWDPLERLWRERFDACSRFVDQTHALPRLSADDREEFVLARWLGRQLHRLQDGALEVSRAEDLNRLLRRSRRG